MVKIKKVKKKAFLMTPSLSKKLTGMIGAYSVRVPMRPREWLLQLGNSVFHVFIATNKTISSIERE